MSYLVQDHKIPSDHFMKTLEANIDNEKLSDKEFRQFVRNTLPIVDYKEKDNDKEE